METLEDYLTEEYHFDKRDIRDIENLIKKIIPTYTKNFDAETAWPYAIGSGTQSQDNLSVNTTAMVLDALLHLCDYYNSSEDKNLGNIPKTNITPILGKSDNKIKLSLEDYIVKATKLLFKNIYPDNIKLIETTSKTYGKDDVFTHAWLAEISRADWEKIRPESFGKDAKKIWNNISDDLYKRAAKTLGELNSFDGQDDLKKLFSPDADDGSRPLPHAFTHLRLIQIIRRIKGKNHPAIERHYKYFERLLHEQLSFSSIPDSRFDPAELTFCLEGMLLCQKNLVDRSVFDRVLSVLKSAQHENAYWRPVKPFLATDRGLALFPVSVEVANSLLRACAIFDGEQLHDTYGSKCIGLLRRYWQWLRARSVRVPNESPELVGWHSEHVNETSVIHSWETSQVVGFFMEYRKALQSHIARTTLIRSRFDCKQLKHKEWNDLEATFEPVTSLGENLRTYKSIGKYFIEPQRSVNVEECNNYSILLYGPPGTGKTTVAESIAKALRRNLITITVSDFLAGGEAQMEARAKNIFDVLLSQPPSVVLFDEIDNFLLDRDSARYSNQDSVFQFMTPGMLTKLNELRRAERVLFIIATNYEDRIDPAIKRTGRIDYKYLLLPPDLNKRKAIIEDLTTEKDQDGKSVKFLFEKSLNEIDPDNNLAKASLFLGFKDIEAVVNLVKHDDTPKVDDLEKLLRERARTTSLESYRYRFAPAKTDENNSIIMDSSRTPIEEFICLVALALETRDDFEPQEYPVVKDAIKVITKEEEPTAVTKEQLKEISKILSVEFHDKIEKAMTKLCDNAKKA